MLSSKFIGNRKLYQKSGYKYEKECSKDGNLIAKYFLSQSSGFGYMPHRAIFFTIRWVIYFALIYTYIETKELGLSLEFSRVGADNFLIYFKERLYYSAITFTTTGYGEVGVKSELIRMLSFLEACLGISVLSMLAYSLTRSQIRSN